MLRIISRFALLLLLCLAAVAQEKKETPLPKGLPAYGPLKTVPPPKVTQEKLPNGLTVWLAPRQGFPKVAFVLAVRGGFAGDPKDRAGITEFLAATIDQGTKTRSARQIAEEFQAAGGDLGASSQTDYLTLSISVLAEKAAPTVALLADVAQNATFPDAEVEIARRNLIQSLALRESNPGFLAQRALAKALFADHPYATIAPTQQSLKETTAADLRNEYAQRMRPDQALLVAVGDFDATKMTAVIREMFGKWTAPAAAAPAALPPAKQNGVGSVVIVPRPGSVQTQFSLAAFAINERDPQYAAARVANAIYGGMFGSRLIKNIREDKGYTYSPRAMLRSYREVGLVSTGAAVRNAVTGASWNEIAYELNRMATTSPTKDELERAQRYLVGNIALSLQSEAAVAGRLSSLWVNSLPPEELGTQTQKIEKVTAADIDNVGRKYFPASRMTVVAVGDEKLIREQLAPFGITVKTAQ